MTQSHPDALIDEAVTSAMSLTALAADERYSDVNTLIGALNPQEYGRLIFAFASLSASFAGMYHEATGLPPSDVSAAIHATRAAYLADVDGTGTPPDL